MEVNLDLTYTRPQQEIFLTDHPQKYIIVPKGRRFGATQGAAQACIERLLEGNGPILWVDTIYANIDRYFDRYFLPVLKKLPESMWSWNGTKKILKVGSDYMDFRSADKPQNIEGFGYRLIFLNEAGIILKNPKLYTETILPMLLDYPDSQLIAAGVPKGMYLPDGNKHKFFELYEKCLNEPDKYKLLQYTSYDNPFLTKTDIDELAIEVSPAEADQEIRGLFVEETGNRPFCTQYEATYHEAPVKFRPEKQLVISLDINFDPFAINFSNYWKADKIYDHQFDEAAIENANVFKVADVIKSRYGKYLSNCIIIGDAMGKRREMSQRDHSSFYQQLKGELGLRDAQFRIPRANPTHENSRSDVNYVLFRAAQGQKVSYKVNPATCPNAARDYKNVQVDNFGSIMKKSRTDINQRADFLDGNRYKMYILWSQWVKRDRMSKK